MKILFITWYFPPSNTIAAVRLGKLAKHLGDQGHEVRIVTAKNPPYPQSLPSEVPEQDVERIRWRDIDWPAAWVKSQLRKVLRGGGMAQAPAAGDGGSEGGAAGVQPGAQQVSALGRLRRMASTAYALVVHFPDQRIGWLPAARRAGIDAARSWQPDGIFASGPPFTTLLIAHLVSRSTGVPLVVEFRDRWSEDPYYPPPAWRRFCNRWLEERIVRQAAGLTTVSEPWAERFRERFAKPVEVIHNGFDVEDFAGLSSEGAAGDDVLRIVYTGGIYRGYRDPSPLFAAIAGSPLLRAQVRVDFYGTNREDVTVLAREQGVPDNVTVHERVSHAEALAIQAKADALLLMQWDNPKEQGNIPGKFAEYLGARRPILVLGYARGVPATVVRERGAGIASTNPAEIAAGLEDWLQTKRRLGRLPGLTDAAVAGFTRKEQAARLGAFLQGCFAPET